jgi:hypothetical protein
MADHGFTTTFATTRTAALAAAPAATIGLAAASWVVAVWQMQGMDMGWRPGSARSSHPPWFLGSARRCEPSPVTQARPRCCDNKKRQEKEDKQ